MTPTQRSTMQAALEWLEHLEDRPHVRGSEDCHEDIIEEIRAALAEQSPKMPSDTRYTVVVEGQAPTYWDNIHDAITGAQRAVYAGVDNLTNAINDLQGGRIAEWSYGFSAVRIYPPQKRAALAEQQEPVAWLCKREDGHYDVLSDSTCKMCFPVYRHPSRREWQGLTDEGRQRILDTTHPDNRWTLAERVEYRLKERNT